MTKWFHEMTADEIRRDYLLGARKRGETLLNVKEELYSIISDTSKDLNGFRARFDFSRCSVKTLCERALYYVKAVHFEIHREEIELIEEAHAMNDAMYSIPPASTMASVWPEMSA